MKKLRLFMSAVLLTAFMISANAGQTIVKTMPLGQSITGTGIVRLVVKVSSSAIGPDMGFTLHEAEPAAPWNDAMAIGMFDFAKNSNGGIHLAGYNAGTWDWETNVKTVEAGKQIVLWITVDAANNLHGLSAQMEGETEVTTVYENYGDRASLQGKANAAANFCSVFVNDRDGATADHIEIVKDAEVVTAIEAYTFEGGSAIRQQVATANVKVAPTVVSDMLTLTSEKAIAQVAVMSLSGQAMITKQNVNKLNVAELSAGVYFVKATTVDGAVAIQRIMKK